MPHVISVPMDTLRHISSSMSSPEISVGDFDERSGSYAKCHFEFGDMLAGYDLFDAGFSGFPLI